jgi:hypothetical protein
LYFLPFLLKMFSTFVLENPIKIHAAVVTHTEYQNISIYLTPDVFLNE